MIFTPLLGRIWRGEVKYYSPVRGITSRFAEGVEFWMMLSLVFCYELIYKGLKEPTDAVLIEFNAVLHHRLLICQYYCLESSEKIT